MAALTNRFEDDDVHHLPPGMKRVGYDERTERYTFRQGDELWLGEPGSLYGGTMKWAGKAPVDPCSASDDDDDDCDTASFETGSDSTSFKKRASGVHWHDGVKTHPDLQESNNEWGVPIASISETNARPPDMTLGRRGTQLKKVAKSTVTAISVTRRWSRKKISSRSEDQEKPSDHQGRKIEKKEVKQTTDSFSEKDLSVLRAD